MKRKTRIVIAIIPVLYVILWMLGLRGELFTIGWGYPISHEVAGASPFAAFWFGLSIGVFFILPLVGLAVHFWFPWTSRVAKWNVRETLEAYHMERKKGATKLTAAQDVLKTIFVVMMTLLLPGCASVASVWWQDPGKVIDCAAKVQNCKEVGLTQDGVCECKVPAAEPTPEEPVPPAEPEPTPMPEEPAPPPTPTPTPVVPTPDCLGRVVRIGLSCKIVEQDSKKEHGHDLKGAPTSDPNVGIIVVDPAWGPVLAICDASPKDASGKHVGDIEACWAEVRPTWLAIDTEEEHVDWGVWSTIGGVGVKATDDQPGCDAEPGRCHGYFVRGQLKGGYQHSEVWAKLPGMESNHIIVRREATPTAANGGCTSCRTDLSFGVRNHGYMKIGDNRWRLPGGQIVDGTCRYVSPENLFGRVMSGVCP